MLLLIRAVTDLLCETLTDWNQGGAYRISVQVQSSSGSKMAAVALNRIRSGNPFVESANRELDGLLILRSHLQKTFATDIFLECGLGTTKV